MTYIYARQMVYIYDPYAIYTSADRLETYTATYRAYDISSAGDCLRDIYSLLYLAPHAGYRMVWPISLYIYITYIYV